jgi:thymidylate synthase (FAD)
MPKQFEIIQPNVKLIAKTQHLIPEINKTAEALVSYCARVSSPHQTKKDYQGLLQYCATHKHFSIFEMIDFTFEIQTSRAIAAQILRHKTASFQEFSQRYATAQSFQPLEARLQDSKNRQNSIETNDIEIARKTQEIYSNVLETCSKAYQDLLDLGVAKEVARFVLPLSTTTKMYMKNNLRNWIFYLEVRAFGEGVQKEHRQIALDIAKILAKECPIVAKAFDWEKQVNEWGEKK